MEATDNSMTVMDDVDAVVDMDSVATSETANDSPYCEDNANGMETDEKEDVTGGVVIGKFTHPTNEAVADSVDNARDDVESADIFRTGDSAYSADLIDSRNMEIDDLVGGMDHSAKEDSNDCESDSESTNEGTCLEAITPYGQDYYLRLGGTPRRRSALRLSRIIARQQLLRRLSQGRNTEIWLSWQ